MDTLVRSGTAYINKESSLKASVVALHNMHVLISTVLSIFKLNPSQVSSYLSFFFFCLKFISPNIQHYIQLTLWLPWGLCSSELGSSAWPGHIGFVGPQGLTWPSASQLQDPHFLPSELSCNHPELPGGSMRSINHVNNHKTLWFFLFVCPECFSANNYDNRQQ